MALSFEVESKDGLLKGMRWQDGVRPVLMLHGWLDNLGTFSRIVNCFKNCDAVAFDFIGQGQSDHILPQSSYSVLSFIRNIHEVSAHLKWTQFDIVGHSFGATLALIYAGMFPERVRSVVCIDGIGNFPAAPKDVVQRLRRSVAQPTENRMLSLGTVEEAVQLRQHSKIPISEIASRDLVFRGLTPVEDGFVWSNDNRLIEEFLYSPIVPVDTFMDQIFEHVACRVLMLLGSESQIFSREAVFRNSSLIRHCKVSYQRGQHHLHIDHPEEVAQSIFDFFNN